MNKKKFLSRGMLIIFLIVLTAGISNASIAIYNSDSNTKNASTREDWLNEIGITLPQYLVDFESDFIVDQNVSGVIGLFPNGLVITDTSSAGTAKVQHDSSYFGSSNPVGYYALAHNEAQYLVFDFSSNPVDYVAFQDIDHGGVAGTVFFSDNTSAPINLETTEASGDSAEFFGIYRNDMSLITKIQIDASGADHEWGIDNIEYGSQVPIPGAALLFGSSIIGLVGVRRKIRK